MPELPEVETIRRQLTSLIIGKTILSIEVLLKKSFIGETKDIIGKKVIGIDRKGKVLILSLRGPKGRGNLAANLYIHLCMSGQLQFLPQEETPRQARSLLNKPPHLRTIIHFTDNSQLQFIDQRTFGFITTSPDVIPKGMDALDLALTIEKLSAILKSGNRPIKQILLDQNLIAGIGNIYASEILWEARINPTLGNLENLGDLRNLYRAIRKILTEAIQCGGSTMSDKLYRQVKGQTGGYQKRFKVYDREGKPCFRCQTKIKKTKQAQRSTYYCPKCQGN